ncbi:serine-type endopeptidase isoform 1 [Gracilaria domingensis]|nr:serine-type endopeptidase isoform 1 [Gracilaria domingensis]
MAASPGDQVCATLAASALTAPPAAAPVPNGGGADPAQPDPAHDRVADDHAPSDPPPDDDHSSPAQPVPISSQGLHNHILDAVLKIYVTHCDPNYSLPWQMRRQTQSTSSGFVISGRRILTNAHSIEHHTVVRVKKRASDRKYIARVLTYGNECDLALLTVEDDAFWHDIQPLPFGRLPELQTSVIVVGYPIGGENISVTAGVVSRVEIQEYTHGDSQLLGIQIDAAINSGSSGGPALSQSNQVVGIAFQSMNSGDAENIGYLVAESVVEHFLKDYERNRKYTGFCHSGFTWQKMENKSLRRCMNMKPGESGVLVRRVMKTSPAHKVLKPEDIVTSIDGVSVSNAGTVPYRSGERIAFHYIITTKFTGDIVKLKILRNGEPLEIEYELRDSSENLLVPVREQRRQPEYFTIAGLVFVALSEPYLVAEYGDKWDLKAPVRLLERLLYGSKEHLDEQIVVLSQVLNAEINIEYECVINTRVQKFNGQKLRNLAHLAKLVNECTDDFLRFDLDDEIVVVGRQEAIDASAEILETHCIPSACSIGELPPVPSESDKRQTTERQSPVAASKEGDGKKNDLGDESDVVANTNAAEGDSDSVVEAAKKGKETSDSPSLAQSETQSVGNS